MLLLENKRYACRRDDDLVLDPSFDTRRFHHFRSLMNSVECICYQCEKKFSRRKACHNQSLRLGRKEFCSRSCSVIYGNKSPKRCRSGILKNLKKGSEKDEYSEFRWFMRVIKQRSKENGTEYDVDLAYLKHIWIEQKGVCPLTGWSMILPKSKSKNIWPEENPMYRASVDRIDSSLGYIKDNIRFIAVIANYAKSIWTDKELLHFCESVVYYQKKDLL